MQGVRFQASGAREMQACPNYDSVKNSTQRGGGPFTAVLSRVLRIAGLRSNLVGRKGCGTGVLPVWSNSHRGYTTRDSGTPFLRQSRL
jgi:hypothetical protein